MQQILPTNVQPNQTLTANLSVDGAPLNLQLTLRYNEIAGYWCMTVQNAQGTVLLDSVPLLTGNDPICNILYQFQWLEIGSAFVLNQTGALTPNYPNNTNLGTGFQLAWGDTP